MMSFIDQIRKNLHSNGFPTKKVSFGLENLYEIADKKSENLNDILESLLSEGINHSKEDDKIIFFQSEVDQSTDQDMFAKAQEAMSKMNPDELQKIKDMAENMSEADKASMMEQAKKMGLL
jgi:hypothetical protein